MPTRARPKSRSAPAPRALAAELPPGYALTVKSWPAAMLWPLTKIVRYANNPRRNAEAVGEVAASLAAYGARQPIVVDEQGVVIVGDTRFLAALQLGWASYPVHVATGLSPAAVKAYRIADNKVGERAEWDFARLKLEFEGLKELDLDLGATGFHDFEIQPILLSDWHPPAEQPLPEGQASGNGDGHKDPPGVVRFDKDQWPEIEETVGEFNRRSREAVAVPEAILRMVRGWLSTTSAAEDE